MIFRKTPEPRRWQRDALATWVGAEYRGITEVVTGGGKTIFAMLCMHSAFVDGIADTFLVIVPTVALLDQWYVDLREELGLEGDDIALWSGRERPSRPARFNVMVANTARSAVRGFPNAARTMLVVDECHRMGSPANAAALVGEFTATLGMSATPDSQFNERLTEVLVPHLGRIIYRYGIEQASADGILAQFDLTNVRLDLLADEQATYDKWTSRIARYSKRKGDAEVTDDALKILLRRRAAVAARAALRVPVAVKLIEENRGLRTLVFHEYVAEAELIRQRLRERGHSVTIYHTGVAHGMRRDNLRLFRRGQFDVLVTCRALDEGINIPEVQVAVIASATASSRQRVQRLGRVLRPAPRKLHASVFTLYATEAEEARLLAEAATLRSANSVSWKRVRIPIA